MRKALASAGSLMCRRVRDAPNRCRGRAPANSRRDAGQPARHRPDPPAFASGWLRRIPRWPRTAALHHQDHHHLRRSLQSTAPLAEIGGKGLFTKEIEEALLDGRIDLAVHSMKDVPTWLPEGLEIAAIPEREDPRDVLIARAGPGSRRPCRPATGRAGRDRIAPPPGARFWRVVPISTSFRCEGNVGTRLRKVADGAADATLLALAGLKRLGEDVDGMAVLEPAEMLPAVGQGALGIECRTGDEQTQEMLQPIVDSATTAAVQCERALLEVLDGSCRMPIAGLAVASDALGRPPPRCPDRAARRQRLPPGQADRGHGGRDHHRPRRRRRAACGRRPRLVRVVSGTRLLLDPPTPGFCSRSRRNWTRYGIESLIEPMMTIRHRRRMRGWTFRAPKRSYSPARTARGRLRRRRRTRRRACFRSWQ